MKGSVDKGEKYDLVRLIGLLRQEVTIKAIQGTFTPQAIRPTTLTRLSTLKYEADIFQLPLVKNLFNIQAATKPGYQVPTKPQNLFVVQSNLYYGRSRFRLQIKRSKITN